MAVKIVAFAGSAREGSYNKKLIKLAAAATEKAGAQVTLIDLRDYPMPLYDQDIEDKQGLPANVKEMKALFKSHDGFLLACPEYNSSMTPLLKNTLDWISRRESGEGELVAFKGKKAALVSASPGALGGLRSLVHVRQMLGNIGVLLVPEQVCISKANEAFDEQGLLKEKRYQEALEKLAKSLVSLTAVNP